MDTTKHQEDIIVLLLSQRYMKLEIQENPEWGTFILEKKKCRICLLSSSNESNCTFLTTRLERTEIHLKSHSNNSKSKNIELDRVFEKLKQMEGENSIAFKRKFLKVNLEI
jgi:hypothetical protein